MEAGTCLGLSDGLMGIPGYLKILQYFSQENDA